MKLLQPSKDPGGSQLTETVAVAITILTINNELNQDAVRYDAYITEVLALSSVGGLYCNAPYLSEHCWLPLGVLGYVQSASPTSALLLLRG